MFSAPSSKIYSLRQGQGEARDSEFLPSSPQMPRLILGDHTLNHKALQKNEFMFNNPKSFSRMDQKTVCSVWVNEEHRVLCLKQHVS